MNPREALPGVVPAGGPDPKLEWVRPDVGVLGALSTRLGSDPRGEELLLAVMRVLRGVLPQDSWEAIADELPFTTRAVLRSDAQAGIRAPRGADPGDAIARAVQQPRARAELEIAAVFSSLQRVLPRGLADAIAQELTAELAVLWRDAR